MISNFNSMFKYNSKFCVLMFKHFIFCLEQFYTWKEKHWMQNFGLFLNMLLEFEII